MVQKVSAVLGELSDEDANIEVGILTGTDSKVVSGCKNVDTVGKCALATNILLEGSRGGSSTIDLAIQPQLANNKHVVVGL